MDVTMDSRTGVVRVTIESGAIEVCAHFAGCGFTGNLRAGEVSWTVTAGAVDVVTVKGVEQ